MLQSMRRSAKSWVMTILFGFLILSFAVWGIGDIFRSGGQSAVIAEVGGVEISRGFFLREYQNEIARVQRRLGGNVPAEFLAQLGLGAQVASQIVERTLFDLAATDLGLLISDETIAATVRTDPNFQGIGGFDKFRYEQAVRAIGLSVAGYEAMLRRDLGRARLVEAMAASETPPKGLADKLYKHRYERRTAEIITVAADAAAIAEPGQAALEAWHKEHERDFMAPAYRAVTAVVLRPEDIMAEIEVTEETLRELYESRMDEFSTPEKRTASQIVFQDEATAKKAHAAIGQGKSLADAAAAAGEPQEELDLGAITRKATLPELTDAIFALAVNGVTAPVKSPLGWHIVKVSKIEPGGVTLFAEAKDKIADEVKRDQAVSVLYDLATAVEDELAGGATIAEAGKAHNVKVVSIAAMDSRGNGRNGKPAPGAPTEAEFLRAAFDTPEGAESDLTEAQSGAIFIVKVEQVTAPALRPLDEVRDTVAAAWKDDQARAKARNQSKDIANAIRGGRAPAEVAGENKRVAVTTKPFTRDGRGAVPALTQALVDKVFDADKGAVVVSDDAKGSAVARVTSVLGADPADRAKARKDLTAGLSRAIAEDLVAQFSAALRASYDVEINAEAIDAVIQPVTR